MSNGFRSKISSVFSTVINRITSSRIWGSTSSSTDRQPIEEEADIESRASATLYEAAVPTSASSSLEVEAPLGDMPTSSNDWRDVEMNADDSDDSEEPSTSRQAPTQLRESEVTDFCRKRKATCSPDHSRSSLTKRPAQLDDEEEEEHDNETDEQEEEGEDEEQEERDAADNDGEEEEDEEQAAQIVADDDQEEEEDDDVVLIAVVPPVQAAQQPHHVGNRQQNGQPNGQNRPAEIAPVPEGVVCRRVRRNWPTPPTYPYVNAYGVHKDTKKVFFHFRWSVGRRSWLGAEEITHPISLNALVEYQNWVSKRNFTGDTSGWSVAHIFHHIGTGARVEYFVEFEKPWQHPVWRRYVASRDMPMNEMQRRYDRRRNVE